jgi:hypothetical protein
MVTGNDEHNSDQNGAPNNERPTRGVERVEPVPTVRGDHHWESSKWIKLAPIIGAVIIGGATITAAIISTRGRGKSTPVTVPSSVLVAIESVSSTVVGASPTTALPLATAPQTTPADTTTAPPRVIVVQVPGSPLPVPSTPPGPVRTVTVYVTVPASSFETTTTAPAPETVVEAVTTVAVSTSVATVATSSVPSTSLPANATTTTHTSSTSVASTVTSTSRP